MQTHFVEVTNQVNHGKFMIQKFDATDWEYKSQLEGNEINGVQLPLLRSVGWSHIHFFVVDLQTGEGAMFHKMGIAHADLNKHKIWVCPMFEPFLTWLYKQDLSDITKLPALVTFTETEAPSALHGYRREGVTP